MKAIGAPILFIVVAASYVQAAPPANYSADGTLITAASGGFGYVGGPVVSRWEYLTPPNKRQAPQRQYWYWPVTPPAAGAETIYVGPYPNRWDCQDMFGSAIYAHPWACHLGLKPASIACRIIGNGFAYPADYPFPAPPGEYIISQDCVENDDPALRLKRGWYFLYYTVNGGGVAACKDYARFKELSTITPGMDLGDYRDQRCPGAPCFSVGMDSACN